MNDLEREYGPFDGMIWIEVYDIAIDALIAIPVRASAIVRSAVAKGQARIVTDEEAIIINAQEIASAQYVDEYVARRWQQIKAQRELSGAAQ